MLTKGFACTRHASMENEKGKQKWLQALNNMVSQGWFGRPTFPLDGAQFPVFKKVRLKRDYISALVNCLVLARAFGQPLAMQGSVPPHRLNPR